jgi:hypothetical protein
MDEAQSSPTHVLVRPDQPVDIRDCESIADTTAYAKTFRHRTNNVLFARCSVTSRITENRIGIGRRV